MVRASELVNKGKNIKNKEGRKEREKLEEEISLGTDDWNEGLPNEKKESFAGDKPREKKKEKVLNLEKDFFPKTTGDEELIKDVEYKTRYTVKTDIPVVESKDEDESEKLYKDALNVLVSSLKLFLEKDEIDIHGIEDVADEFIRNLQNPSSSLIAKALFYKSASFNLIQHQVDVGVLSLKVGMALGVTGDKLRQLLVGAMLHDIGFAKIPREIIEKQGELTESEMKEIKKHPEYSKQYILEALGGDYEWLAEIVNREHERLDGSGYPHGLNGKEIGITAEIIGISDIYEALTHTRPQRARMTPFDAVKLLINSYKNLFSKDVLKALVSEWSAFPLGSYVLLSSNKVGKVINVNPLSPLKPKVKVIYDSKGNKLEKEEIIDLNRDTLLYIVAPVFYEDLVS